MQRQLHGRRLDRKGLTLVELLAVISIIGILASMVLVAMRGAQQDSLEAKTRSTIAKIHEVLAAKYESYLTQAMPLKIPSLAFERTNGVRALSSREMARIRLLAVRDLMRLEMPDRPGDVKYLPGASVEVDVALVPKLLSCRLNETDTIPVSGTPFFPLPRISPPASFLEIRRELALAQSALGNTRFWEQRNANEELLYLVVSQQQIDNSSALELFGANEIGDTDNDGLKEFIDAWGNPIAWIRWPAGLDGAGGIFNTVEPFSFGDATALDPLDPLMSDLAFDKDFELANNRQYKPGNGLFPLVVSAGADGKHGIRFTWDGVAAFFSQADYEMSDPILLPDGYRDPLPFPDPYYPRTATSNSARLGAILDSRSAADNISNLDDFGAAL